MPLVVLEAMASGLPVIVSNRGPDQVVRDGIDGFVVSAGDIQGLSSRLRYLMEHPERRLEMGRSAAMRAQEFSWAQYVDGVINVLEHS